MKFIELNPLAAKPKGKREPYDELVGKMLGAEAQAAVLRLKERKVESAEDYLDEIDQSTFTESEKILAEAVRIERKAQELFREAAQAASNIVDNVYRLEALADLARADVGLNLIYKALDQIEDYRTRFEAFYQLGIHLAEIGQDPKKAFLKAKTAALEVQNDWSSRKLAHLVTQFDELGLLKEASEILPHITYGTSRWESFSTLAYSHAKRGLLVEAMNLAEQIEDEEYKFKTYIQMASVLTGRDSADVLVKAEAVATELSDKYNRSKAFSELAQAQFRAGQDPTAALDESERAFEQLRDDNAGTGLSFNQDFLLETLIEAGQFERAKSLILGPYEKNLVYSAIAIRQAAMGELEDAIKTAKNISDHTVLMKAIDFIVEKSASVGKFTEAEKAIVVRPFFNDRAKLKLVTRLADLGEVEKAKKVTVQIQMPTVKNEARSVIACKLARNKDYAGAKNMILDIEDIGSREEARCKLVSAMVYDGNLGEEAKNTAFEIKGSRDRSSALDVLARGLINNESLDEAREIALQIKDPAMRSLVFSSLTRTLIRVGKLPEARLSALEIESFGLGLQDLEVLCSLAAELAKVGQDTSAIFDKINEMLPNFSDEPVEHVQALSLNAFALLIAGQPSAQLFAQAKEEADALEAEDHVKACLAIVSAYTRAAKGLRDKANNI